MKNDLAAILCKEFEQSEKERRAYEDRWLRDLRQYKGQYDDSTLNRLGDKRSKAFVKYTRKKCKSVLAKLLDLLFPANGDKNWSIESTPVPENPLAKALNPSVRQQMQDAATKSMEDIAQAMSREMEDQLAEAPNRVGYREQIRRVLKSGLTYGTGILKGPLVEYENRDAWFSSPEGWEIQVEQEVLRPSVEAVTVWDVYPDHSAVDLADARYVWQRHVISKADLLALAKRSDFDGDEIRQHIADNPEGKATYAEHETEKRSLTVDGSNPELKFKYVLLERWGYVSGKDLADCGCDISEEEMLEEIPACVWLLDNRVVKAVRQPIEGVTIPYYFWYFDKDETSVWGEGLPSTIYDEQEALNGAVRMLLDNAAISAGPQIAVNLSALHEGDDPTNIYPFKVWRFHSAQKMAEAMQVFSLPSTSEELIQIASYFQNWMDEVTLPAHQQGDTAVRGAGETASGLSMLFQSANIDLTELVRSFDDNITQPFFTALYHWNMQFNEREDIKGDMQVRARGTSDLMAREVKATVLTQALSVTADPRFGGWIKHDELLREYFRCLGLPEELLRTQEEYQLWQQQQQPDPLVMAEVAERQARAKELEAQAQENLSKARENEADAESKTAETETEAFLLGQQMRQEAEHGSGEQPAAGVAGEKAQPRSAVSAGSAGAGGRPATGGIGQLAGQGRNASAAGGDSNVLGAAAENQVRRPRPQIG